MKGLYLDKMPPPTDTNGVCMALKDCDVLIVAIDAPGTMATLRHLIDPSNAIAKFATVPCIETEYIAGDPKFFIGAIKQVVYTHPAQMTIIVNGPVGMLIGIDLEHIALEVEKQTSIPTRYVETTGNGSYKDGLSQGKKLAEEFNLIVQKSKHQKCADINPGINAELNTSINADLSGDINTELNTGINAGLKPEKHNIPAPSSKPIQQEKDSIEPKTNSTFTHLSRPEQEEIDDLEPYQLADNSEFFSEMNLDSATQQNFRQIAFYGKGGIGKSTVAQNVAGALAARMQKKVMLVGCDPKADSTRLLTHDGIHDTVLDILQAHNNSSATLRPKYEDLIKIGFGGIKCVEAGGPEPGVGCAGRGILAAFSALDLAHAYTDDLDYVFYDVLGDVVCGGFAAPIRSGRAQEVYLVVSGELMSLYAANNICKGLARYSAGGARLAGIICNSRNVKGEHELASAFANAVSSILIATIARDDSIQQAEINRQTVIEYAPESKQAALYAQLANDIENNKHRCIPTPLSAKQLESLMRAHGL